MGAEIRVGDCRAVLATLEPDSLAACVTDPPYGLEFMGKAWDAPWKQGAGLGGNTAGFGAVVMADGASRLDRPSFHGSPNPTCRNCGGLRRGKEGKRSQQPCRCAAPRFDDMLGPRQRAFQAWSTEWAESVYRVLAPGAHLVAFGGTRTFHRLTCAIEDAGFEVRDCLSWLYGSGFPKSRNLDGDWQGWGTALKPAWEPIILARKPLAAANVQANAERFGTGAMNVDGCRIGTGEDKGIWPITARTDARGAMAGPMRAAETDTSVGRWPANVALDAEAAAALDAQTGELTSGLMLAGTQREGIGYRGGLGTTVRNDTHGDSGGASRFFYCAKADRSERNAGLEGLPERVSGMRSETSGQHITRRDGGAPGPRANHHPTVKPLDLMRWLVRLVTPPGGTVLDPFMGSGTTGAAAVLEGFGFLGIEREAEYAEIARARIRHWRGPLFGDVALSLEDGAAA